VDYSEQTTISPYETVRWIDPPSTALEKFQILGREADRITQLGRNHRFA